MDNERKYRGLESAKQAEIDMLSAIDEFPVVNIFYRLFAGTMLKKDIAAIEKKTRNFRKRNIQKQKIMLPNSEAKLIVINLPLCYSL